MQSNQNPFEHLIPKETTNENPFEHLVPKNDSEIEPKNFIDKLKRAGGILGEDISKIPGALAESALNKINAAPKEIPGYFHQMAMEPAKAMTGFARGLGKVEKGAVNLGMGPDVASYLAHLKLIKPETAEKYFPEQTENLMERFLGKSDKEPGSALIESLPGAVGFVSPLITPAKMAAKGLKNVANLIPSKIDAEQIAKGLGYKKELEQVKNELPELEKNILEKKPMEEKALQERLLREKELQESETAAAISTKVASKNPTAIQLDINQANERLANINKQLNESKSQRETLKKPEEFKTSETSHIEQLETAKQRKIQAEENILKSEKLHEEAKKNAELSEESLGTHLDKEATHDVQLMAPLDKFVSDIEKESSKNYNKFHEELKENNIQIIKDKKSKKEMNRLKKINKDTMKGNKYYKAIMKKAPKKADTDASTYFAKFRSFRDAFYNLRKDSNAHGIDSIDRMKMRDAVESLNPIKKIITDTLENGIGKERGSRLEELNKHHREVVTPLRGNKLIKAIRNPQGKELPSNIAASLRLPRKGNILIKEHIKKNPELIKNVVGQRYAVSPESVHKPNKVMQEFINAHPETKSLIEQRNQAFKTTKETNKNIKEAKKINIKETKNLPKAEAEYKLKESEISDLTQENQKKIKDYEKQNEKLNSEIKEHESKIQEETSKNEARQNAIKDLKEKADKKTVSVQEHAKAKKQYDEVKKQINDSHKKISNLEKKLDSNRKRLSDNKGIIKRTISLGKTVLKYVKKIPGL